MVDTNYIKSWAGGLKIGQFIALLIAFSTLAQFSNKSGENNGGFKFFLFITITSWLIVFVLFCLFVTKVYERIPLNWSIAMIIYSASELLLLLIASSIVAEKARKLRRSVTHPDLKYYDTCSNPDYHCGTIEASVIFGFICVALFLGDTVFYFMKHRDSAESSSGIIQGQVATTDTNPDYVEEIP